MQVIRDVLDWFTGGSYNYMTLYHCMNHDTFWMVLTVSLDLAIFIGYLLIVRHWWINQRGLRNREARNALGHMRNIFIFCGLCGYLFIPIKMFWPAWRLYDIFLVILAYYTWRYALSARELKVVYRELGRAEELGSRLQTTREESQRKSRFLNAIGHDLKNPLYGLYLQAELATEALKDNDVKLASESVAMIRSAAQDTRDLLENFLELGRLDWSQDPVNVSDFPVEPLVRDVMHCYQSLAEQKGLNLTARIDPKLVIATDRRKMHRMISNLVNNALKYTDRGSVTIESHVERDTLRLDVIDTGAGFTAGQADRIFEEFYQIDNPERTRSKGFGMGLSITQRLAQQLGGTVEVESQEGIGSRFTVVLPSVVTDGAGAAMTMNLWDDVNVSDESATRNAADRPASTPPIPPAPAGGG